MNKLMLAVGATAIVFAGCDPDCSRMNSPRVGALDASAWACSQWLSAKDAPVYDGPVRNGMNCAPGTSWFVGEVANAGEITSVRWMTAGLGVYEVYVNGQPVGRDFLKPGFTHPRKTKYSFTYDVTKLLKAGAGERNVFSAEVSSGWWRDKIVSPGVKKGGFAGRKSAFRGVLEFTFADGTKRLYGTNTKDWKAGVAGPVTQAGIFDGEVHDARLRPGYECTDALKAPEVNEEFKGEILPTAGAEVCLRCDLAMRPAEAYVWKEATGASDGAFGTVVKTRAYAADDTMRIAPGEKLVLDFGQNAAAIPFFRFRARRGTVLTALPAEMLNDGNGDKKRGNDGPEGSVYRVNLRSGHETGRLVRYTFAGEDLETYSPRFSFFGYRYMSVSATDEVEIETIRSVPVTSIRKDMELGRIETGAADVNRLIQNVYWGQLSNYLSVPTDCPQRDERLGWSADTQVFCEAGTFNADARDFFRKWMRDMRDTQGPAGGFPGVAPSLFTETMRFGWSDAGVIVPYQVWKQFGDVGIVEENWAAMERFMARAAETKYRTENLPECHNYQWSDWLSLTKYESCAYKPEFAARQNGKLLPEALCYWDYLGGCYWLWDAQRMAEMAAAIGRAAEAGKYRRMADEAKVYLKKEFFTSDGTILPIFRGMQTPALFALKLGLVEGQAKDATIADLRASIAAGGGTLHTGFLGTSIVMDTLTESGLTDVAYSLLFNHKFPGWLYSVDQGATTIWERWNGYTKEKGFGPVSMNSFNHYAYGAVLAWIYKTTAGIAADPKSPGFKNVIMAPKPDRRLGFVKAEYKSAAGLIKSAWHYEGDTWVWEFTIPEGATADVTLPGESAAKRYGSGTHVVRQGPCACKPADLPSEAHMDWLKRGIMAIVHFGPNTFTDQEWGFGDTDPKLFNPTRFDARQWVAAAKAGGIRRMVLVAKHHDGFCLWPSKLNADYTVANSPWKGGKGDLVKDLRDACVEAGLDFGVYLSPWDRHHAEYARPAYVDYFHGQWDEIMDNYGPISEIWLDGANGGDGWYGGAKEKRSIPKDYYNLPWLQERLVRKYPRAVAFQGMGANCLRWCGNEAGFNAETCYHAVDGSWRPPEADTPLRRGWFWHQYEAPKSLKELVDSYFWCVGRNAVLNLGLAPNREGLIGEDDVARLKEFGDYVRAYESSDVAKDAKLEASPDGRVVTLTAGKPVKFNAIDLGENIVHGQRVDAFAVEALVGGVWKEIAKATTIGYRRILRIPETEATAVRLSVTKATANPEICSFRLRVAPEVPETFVASGLDFISKSKLEIRMSADPMYVWFRSNEKTSLKLRGFAYKPDAKSLDGVVDRWAVDILREGRDWECVEEGEFGNIRANPTTQTVVFRQPVEGLEIRIRAVRAVEGKPCFLVRQLDVFE